MYLGSFNYSYLYVQYAQLLSSIPYRSLKSKSFIHRLDYDFPIRVLKSSIIYYANLSINKVSHVSVSLFLLNLVYPKPPITRELGFIRNIPRQKWYMCRETMIVIYIYIYIEKNYSK